jgi:ribosomal-protein-alanine N-acetyltransferase
MSAGHSPTLIRPATEPHLPAILEIERLSFEHAGERFERRKIKSLIHSRRAIAVVADDSGAITGWAAGFTWRGSGPAWGRIYALAIHPRHRGRRLGPRLLKHLIDDLRRRGAGEIILEVRIDNASARRLYEKFGFREVRRLPNFYGPGLNALRMQLPATV